MSNVKIVSDGIAANTEVLVEGVPMTGISRIEILPIVPRGIVRVKVTIERVSLEMEVQND